MKINNKGITLIELLISIVLVGIVLVFIFGLLVDLKNETSNNNFLYNNQTNRIEAIYTIQNDLNKYSLLGIEAKNGDNKVNIILHFNVNEDIKTAVVSLEKGSKSYIKYQSFKEKDDGSFESVNYTWEVKGGTIDLCGNNTFYKDDVSNNYYLKIHFNIYNVPEHEKNMKGDNNLVDDFELTYFGEKVNLVDNITYNLTNSVNDINENIGICTN